MRIAPARLAPGTRVGRYSVQDHLGSGAMAVVYRAIDFESGREVALKLLNPSVVASVERLRRFEREARAISSTHHENVVSILEVGWHGRIPFIAMEYVPGWTLRRILDAGPMPVAAALEVAIQIADGLAAAHRAGIVHRDLKPENVISTVEGWVKILDFGLSKPLGGAKPPAGADLTETEDVLTIPGTILGTLHYMSPEQASGSKVDFRSDQFSLGSILYEMVTAVVAFKRDTVVRTLAAIIEGKPAGFDRFQTESPREVRRVVERALSKSPDERYPSMRELGSTLRAARLSPSLSQRPMATSM
jgi:serine/threonine protein kinase